MIFDVSNSCFCSLPYNKGLTILIRSSLILYWIGFMWLHSSCKIGALWQFSFMWTKKHAFLNLINDLTKLHVFFGGIKTRWNLIRFRTISTIHHISILMILWIPKIFLSHHLRWLCGRSRYQSLLWQLPTHIRWAWKEILRVIDNHVFWYFN